MTAGDGAARGPEARHRRFHPQLRRTRASSRPFCPQQVPQPAGQRLDGHRRRHGVQPAAAQPARDLRRDRSRDRQPGVRAARTAATSCRGRISPPAESSAARTASSTATRTGRGQHHAPRQAATSKTTARTGQSDHHRRDSLRRHPQDDRRIRSPSAVKKDLIKDISAINDRLRPRAQVPDRDRSEARCRSRTW